MAVNFLLKIIIKQLYVQIKKIKEMKEKKEFIVEKKINFCEEE